jgi:DNA-binding XRE family transcriptional regulator
MPRRAGVVYLDHDEMESVRPASAALPTAARPGSSEKIAELARRAAKREDLHATGDLVLDDIAADESRVKGDAGNRVRVIRQRKGWSQNCLSRRAGVPQPTVSAIEAGQVPLLRTVIRLAQALGVGVDELIGFRAA